MMMPCLQSGSPTADLFVESYNNTGKTNKITLDVRTYGYQHNSKDNRLKPEDNHAIYDKSASSVWWLASPSGNDSGGDNGNRELFVNGYWR